MTELVARQTEGARVTMRGMLESATWPLRKLAWKIEEKVIWRVADVIRRRPVQRSVETEYTPAQTELTAPAPSVVAGEKTSPRLRVPSLPRLRAPSRDISIALATVAVAVGGGIGFATLVAPGDSQPTSSPAGAGGGPAASQPRASTDGRTGSAQPTTLQGVAPDFEAASKTEGPAAATSTDAQVSPTQGTNSKPSSIPPGVARNIDAMNTARNFAGAFVLYEVGKSNAKVKKAFARTAAPTLARALSDRPPRLPDSVQVPTAKVQNVVLGAPNGREMDASVSLLRLGDLSELRLSLTRRHGAWLVSEVRG